MQFLGAPWREGRPGTNNLKQQFQPWSSHGTHNLMAKSRGTQNIVFADLTKNRCTPLHSHETAVVWPLLFLYLTVCGQRGPGP